jgi:hypothetical protein
MAKERTKRPMLPPETDERYLEEAVTACINIYERLQDDTHTLNYMGIKGKWRPLVLKNERYMQETRMRKAELYLDEIEDIEEMLEELQKEEINANQKFDIRNMDQKDVNAFAKDSKDRFTQILKLKDRRAELRSMTKDTETEEANALNIIFIAVTAEEFANMQNAEIHEGSDEDIGALKSEEKKDELVVARREMQSKEAGKVPFRMDAQGNLISIPE